MSEFAEIRRDFNRQAAEKGWAKPEDVVGSWPIPVDRWLGRFYKSPHFKLDRQRRLVNHFLVGADPEFVFTRADGTMINADYFDGLKAGLAYGADNNGRLVEIRPKPSRFVLKTLASIWSTMKWMAILQPNAAKCVWRAGAFYNHDGLGGHVHFGRQRPQRDREMRALDTLSFFMFHAGIWDRNEGRRRVHEAQGALHGRGYGHLGDFRAQPYGYEYRTFPSWLCSPWMAYLSMVLAKLAVYDPSLFPMLDPAMEDWSDEAVKTRLAAILAYYKGLDDDATLAYEIFLRHGWPLWYARDFKLTWGITTALPKVSVDAPPIQIAAEPSEIAELAEAMLAGRVPQARCFEPNWPASLPKDYVAAINLIDTRHTPGIGELIAGLAVPKGTLQLAATAGTLIQVSKALLPTGWEKFVAPKLRHFVATAVPEEFVGIAIGTERRTNETRAETLEFLLSGLFPIWKIADVRADSLERWQDRFAAIEKAPSQFSKRLL